MLIGRSTKIAFVLRTRNNSDLLFATDGSPIFTQNRLRGVDGGLAFGRGTSCHGLDKVALQFGVAAAIIGVDHLESALDGVKAARETSWVVVVAAPGVGCGVERRTNPKRGAITHIDINCKKDASLLLGACTHGRFVTESIEM